MVLTLSLAQQSFTFALPESLPSGQYLARVEQVRRKVGPTSP